ncbi:MAG: hypothetical protein HYX32_12590 [Actinobacteria bacterium]|nr:hypothetical protein [Actinomycetota bacterium]
MAVDVAVGGLEPLAFAAQSLSYFGLVAWLADPGQPRPERGMLLGA